MDDQLEPGFRVEILGISEPLTLQQVSDLATRFIHDAAKGELNGSLTSGACNGTDEDNERNGSETTVAVESGTDPQYSAAMRDVNPAQVRQLRRMIDSLQSTPGATDDES